MNRKERRFREKQIRAQVRPHRRRANKVAFLQERATERRKERDGLQTEDQTGEAS